MWATRPISGDFGSVGARTRIWMSEVRDLVGGEPLTPFVRVAAWRRTSPAPSPTPATRAWSFINTDVTLYLHRVPITEWIGYEVVNHGATDGVAIGECFLYDEQGPIGSSSVAALAQKRSMG